MANQYQNVTGTLHISGFFRTFMPIMRRLALLILLATVLPSCIRKVDLDAEILDGEEDAVCWMERLADDTPLRALSIPGAHDAASSSITAWPSWTRTQEKDIAGLWNCGVRAFDLRPALVDGELGIFHDKYSAHVTLPQVMRALLLALDRHPGEGAIIIIRHEQEADGNAPGWKDAMGSYLGSIRSRLVDYRPDLTLGELRGKVLVLSRDEYSGGPLGGYIRNWSSGGELSAQTGASVVDAEGETSPLWVQDYYHPEGMDDKWAAVAGLFDAMESAGDTCPLVINHASGYLGSLPDYRGNARNINIQATRHILSRRAPAGIVMMDFAGVNRTRGVYVGGDVLVQALIEKNRVYLLSEN